jgi:hypothetical protein
MTPSTSGEPVITEDEINAVVPCGSGGARYKAKRGLVLGWLCVTSTEEWADLEFLPRSSASRKPVGCLAYDDDKCRWKFLHQPLNRHHVDSEGSLTGVTLQDWDWAEPPEPLLVGWSDDPFDLGRIGR